MKPLNDVNRRANLRAGSSAATRAAAHAMNVSPRSVEYASKVLREGVPELAAAVRRGGVAISAAAELAELPPEQQREIIALGERAITAKAKELRTAKRENNRARRNGDNPEFQSLISPPTALELLRKAWQLASQEERTEFAIAIVEPMREQLIATAANLEAR